ncbi:hypothetical protein LQW54_006589 [Pestalotiopsis sp. IQ-011]
MSLDEENGRDFKRPMSDVDSDEQRVKRTKRRDSTDLLATTGPDPNQQLRETMQLKDEIRRLRFQIEANEAKMQKERIDRLKTVVRLQEDLRKDPVRRDEVEMHRTKINANGGNISQHEFLIEDLQRRIAELDGVPNAALKAGSDINNALVLKEEAKT